MKKFSAPLIFSLALITLFTHSTYAQSNGQISGKVTDRTAGALASAKVTLKNLATQTELTAATDKDGKYAFDNIAIGLYRLRVEQAGFSIAARNVTLAEAGEKLEANFDLAPGSISDQVSVTAARGERDTLEVSVRTEAVGSEELQRQNATTTQDTLLKVPNVTIVGNGPFQQRPRLRGLDSSRILILVDGERLNTTRVATDRAGVEIGLADPSNLQSVEVISGSGSVLYGTDALSGTINFISHQPQPSAKLRVGVGLNTFYSSNEDGRRGTAEWSLSGKRFALRFSGMLERYANYHAGESFAESSAPFINRVTVFSTTPAAALAPPRGLVTQQIFGGVFPDNFNAPFTRTSSEIPNSNSHGNAFSGVGRLFFTDNDVLRASWNRRRNDNIGFADFTPKFFSGAFSSPFSNLDKYGLRYQKSGLTPWFTGFSINAYHQQQDRVLHTELTAFAISGPPQRGSETITRVEVLSDTRQNVKSYGYDVQANFHFAKRNILTAGTSFFRDHSRDSRVSRTRVNLAGAALIPPAPPTFIPIGVLLADTTSFPQRVPKSNFDNYGFFVQDEVDVTKRLRIIGGLRVDRFNVESLNTPGYNPVLAGLTTATPAVDLSKLPSVNGTSINRTTVTGDIGAVIRVTDDFSLSGRVGRSYRHPNLEELFFAGPATVGSIIPNITVKPETGINVDLSAKLRKANYAASFSYFNNNYNDFISTEPVTRAAQPTGLISQALNFAKVRIQGFELDGEYSHRLGSTVLTPFLTLAYLRGDIKEAVSPFTGARLNNVPADNISPLKAVVGFRWMTSSNRWWTEYNVRAQAHVERVSPLLADSPSLIVQDLFSLAGFGIHTWRGGYNFNREHGRVALTLGLENFTNEFFREQFQFAPARGRSFTVGLVLKYF